MDRQERERIQHDQEVLFSPRTWRFWRTLILCFCYFSIVGHWLEIPYCLFMHMSFGIVEGDYAVWHDPLWVPYWVYGIGAVVMTFTIEPIKEQLLKRRKTIFGAVCESFVIAVVLSMLLELIIGLIINQPNEYGHYPYWDNSQLPLNIFGQAWLVNDIVIGLVAMLYVWVLYPLICRWFSHMSNKHANYWFIALMILFIICCAASYGPEWLGLVS